MRNTKMILSWIFLATIPSCLAFTLEQIEQTVELYVLKYPTQNELTCLSEDDDAALIWNDDLRTSEPSDDFNNFEPVKPIENILMNSGCAIWKSRQCFIKWSTSYDWNKVSSLTHPMAPVYDFRWEGFKEYVVDTVEQKNVLSLDAEDGTIIFSIRATNDVQIRLCKDTEVGLPSCFVIKFAVTGGYSSIKYCESRGTGCYETAHRPTRIPAFLDADKWRTFRLQWIKNERKIKVFLETYGYVFLQSTLEESQFIRNILISSSAPARIRVHDYMYNLATNQNSTLATKEFDWPDGSSCVKMLISLCPECYLTVNLIDRSSNKTLANKDIHPDEQYYSSQLREWQRVKLTLPSKSLSQRQVRLQFEAGLNNNNRKDNWWAIDDLRLCEQNGENGVRKSTIKLPSSDQTGVGTNIKCQKLLREKIAVANSSTSLPPYLTTRLTQYVKNLTKSYSPECRVSSTTNCDDNYITSNRQSKAGNEGEAPHNHSLGVGCFYAIPGKRNFTLDYTSNSLPCREDVGRFSLSVFVRRGNFESARQSCTTIPCQFDIVSLKPFTTYNVVVKSPSHVVIFDEDIKTLESAPEAIRDLIFESITATSVKGRWKSPGYANGFIRYYTVTIQKVESLGCKDHKKSSSVAPEITKNVTNTMASFSGLHPYTAYRFKVIANTFEPGPPYPEFFVTGQLNIPTSQVSDLRIVNKSILAWDSPANCTSITGFTNFTKLVFRGVSTWVKNYNFLTVTPYYEYDLNRLKLLPHTTYEVCAYVARNNLAQVNPSNCQELQWTTVPDAPPAVTDVQIYDADAFGRTVSVRCKPPYPPYGEIESYRVSIMNRLQEIANRLINVSVSKTCKEPYVCIENLSLPSDISIDDNLELQILARNTNVSAEGAVSLKRFRLNDLYNEAPDTPRKLQANPGNHGIVMLTWSHPSFTPTKIVRFRIQAQCSYSNLTTNSCENIPSFYYTITNAEKKYYSMELHLQTSTKYHLHVMAFNYRNKTSKPITKYVSTSGSVSFASKDELRVTNAIDVVILEIPAVLNATRDTTIVIKVEGLSLCAPNTSRIESPSKNKTKITMNWDAEKYSVNSDQPFNFTFDLNKHYGGQKICRSQPMETYRFVVTLTDPALKKPLTLETAPIAFTDEKSPLKQIKTWLVILIPILVICLLLIILLIWYRKHKQSKMQTIDSQGAPSDLRRSIPVNSRVQSGDAQNVPLEPPYMIPRNLSEQASHLQNVALAPVYMNIPNDSRQGSSYGENVPSDPEYWEILDNSWEQLSHPQNVALAPIYMNTLDNSKGESSYPRDASLEPEYLIILDDSREEMTYA